MDKGRGFGFSGFSTANLRVRLWDDWLRPAEKRAALENRLAQILTPPVLAHLPPSLQLPEAENAVQGWVSARAAESRVFVVVSAADQAIIGLLFLAQLPGTEATETYHLGYLLAESRWGRGYGTELVKGLVAAKGIAHPARIVGGVDKNNAASAKVLLKSGFVRADALSSAETDQFVYTVPKG